MDESWLGLTLGIATLYSLLCAGVVYVIWKSISRFASNFLQWRSFWLAGITCAALPFFYGLLPADLTAKNPVSFPLHDYIMAEQTQNLSAAHTSPRAKSNLFPKLPAAFISILLSAWFFIFLTVLIVKGIFLAKNWINIRHTVKRSKIPDDESYQKLRSIIHTIANEQVQRYVKQGSLRIVVSEEYASPFVFGIVKPTLVLPSQAPSQWQDEELSLILEHELIHICQRDPFLMLVIGLVSTVFWFNPFIIALANQTIMALELSCDTAVINNDKCKRTQYLRALLKVVQGVSRKNDLGITTAFGNQPASYLKARIHCIANSTMRGHVSLHNTVSLLILGITVMIGSFLVRPHVNAQVVSDQDIHASELSQSVASAELSSLDQVRTQWPVKKGRISSRYGRRQDPFSGQVKWHQGMDFAGAHKSEVVATADGVVIFAENKKGYGLLVEIQHAEQLITRYGHLLEAHVDIGQTVEQDDVIGLMGGDDPNSTGPHVHYEVFQNGRPVCPTLTCNHSEI